MILQSKNFEICLWNWDWLCLNNVMTKYNPDTWIYPEAIIDEDFLKKVWYFALQLAEETQKKYLQYKE